jgi:hypothetical protein
MRAYGGSASGVYFSGKRYLGYGAVDRVLSI